MTKCKVCGGLPDKPKSICVKRDGFPRGGEEVIVPWHDEDPKCNALWCIPCCDFCHALFYTTPRHCAEEPFQTVRLIRELMMRENAR